MFIHEASCVRVKFNDWKRDWAPLFFSDRRLFRDDAEYRWQIRKYRFSARANTLRDTKHDCQETEFSLRYNRTDVIYRISFIIFTMIEQ